MSAKKRGLFIVLEGLDRSGKTTACEGLYNALKHKGVEVESIRFPNRQSETGKLIDDYLKGNTEIDREFLHELFCHNRAEHSKYINEKLKEGTYVICDRYAHSGVVYSMAKGMKFDDCIKGDVGNPRPDKVFYLNVSPEEAKKRGGYGLERYETEEFQRKVRDAFVSMIVKLMEHGKDVTNFHGINADMDANDLVRVLTSAITLDGTEKPIEVLW